MPSPSSPAAKAVSGWESRAERRLHRHPLLQRHDHCQRVIGSSYSVTRKQSRRTRHARSASCHKTSPFLAVLLLGGCSGKELLYHRLWKPTRPAAKAAKQQRSFASRWICHRRRYQREQQWKTYQWTPPPQQQCPPKQRLLTLSSLRFSHRLSRPRRPRRSTQERCGIARSP